LLKPVRGTAFRALQVSCHTLETWFFIIVLIVLIVLVATFKLVRDAGACGACTRSFCAITKLSTFDVQCPTHCALNAEEHVPEHWLVVRSFVLALLLAACRAHLASPEVCQEVAPVVQCHPSVASSRRAQSTCTAEVNLAALAVSFLHSFIHSFILPRLGQKTLAAESCMQLGGVHCVTVESHVLCRRWKASCKLRLHCRLQESQRLILFVSSRDADQCIAI